MLKSVSSAVNAIGALNYVGTWNASTNTPTLVSGTGTKGDYYVVSVAGSTSLNGISNWGVGDWVVFNGSAWQRVEGGADLNGVNLSVSGTSTFGDNAAFSVAGKGTNFTANTPAAGMTSQLLNWYEEGTWTFTLFDAATGGNASPTTTTGRYVRVGRMVVCSIFFLSNIDTTGMTAGNRLWFSLPFGTSRGGSGSAQVTQFVFGASAFVTPVVDNAQRGFFAISTNNNTGNNIVVSNLTSGQSDILYFNLVYQV